MVSGHGPLGLSENRTQEDSMANLSVSLKKQMFEGCDQDKLRRILHIFDEVLIEEEASTLEAFVVSQMLEWALVDASAELKSLIKTDQAYQTAEWLSRALRAQGKQKGKPTEPGRD